MLLGFVLTVIGVALGIILGVILIMIAMLNKKIMQWYLNYAKKVTSKLFENMTVDDIY